MSISFKFPFYLSVLFVLSIANQAIAQTDATDTGDLLAVVEVAEVTVDAEEVKEPVTTTAATTNTIPDAELNIFPNPNRGTFYITVINEESYHSQLYAMDGRMIQTIHLKSGLNYIDVNVPAGIYLLEVGEGDVKQQFKISVK
ncbi:MAG: T9SS type A sorting domain-containing protein [Crocinitomix sp.]|nr:T9SS type A sorting domain-containing protein [Crocinitomix sp.]